MSVEFLFDYASPWSFLADAILPRSLPGIAVRKRPVYLRGFSSFAQGMPYGPEKLAYQGQPGKPAGMLVFDVELISIK